MTTNPGEGEESDSCPIVLVKSSSFSAQKVRYGNKKESMAHIQERSSQ